MKIPTFRDFPDALAKLPDSLRSKKIVTYCTGGIRCEKASVVMIKDGFENVMQLDGGILAYFEECGDSHWTGDCFVFDQRVALDHNLAETSYEVCFKCRQPLSMDEQKSENYQINQYCPYCRDSSPTATKSTNSHL
jgi:predicted sulfurtransferase